jgi:hypothetical protein
MITDKEQYYINLIKTSCSICEVCKKANISITTGNYDTIKKIISKYNIDVSHFKSQSKTKYENKKIELDDVLSNKRYISAYKLKNLLIKNGLKEEVCESCGLHEWLGKKIPLQLHHIDGNKNNNNFDNLKILCPNCHTFTETWCGKNIKKVQQRYCSVCGKAIEKGNGKYCSIECRNKSLFNKSIGELKKDVIINALSKSKNVSEAAFLLDRSRNTLIRAIKKLNIDPKDYLINKKSYNIDVVVKTLLSNRNYTKTGKIFGVSDNAIRKRLKLNNLPTDLSDLEQIYNERLNI